MGLPRHCFNLVSGLICCTCCTYAWWCDNFMRCVGLTAHVTTLLFHGAHCAGKERWADTVLMKYDVAVVVVAGISAIIKTTDDARLMVLSLLTSLFGLWLLTFGPLKGLPFNPIQSIIHACGSFIHLYAAAPVCARA